MQVVTNENMAEFIQNRSVPEFVPPKADAKVEVKADEPAKDEAAKAETPPRGADGKFVKAEEPKADEAAKAADDSDDPDDADLPERVRKQIGKKHRAMREAEEFAREMRAEREAERERADRAEAALNALKSGPADAKDPKEPKAEDFKTVGEYAEALAEYKVEKKFAEREAKQAQERQEAAARAAQDALNKRIAATVKELPDYAEVIADSDLDIPPHMAVYIAESPIGPKLGYHFAKHPEDFDRINALSPIRAIAELGKLEDRLDKKPEAKEAKAEEPSVSRAPSPIKPLDGTAAPVQKDPAKMTIQELREYERTQRLARARR